MNATDPIETLEQAFSCFDHDGTGKIKKEDMEFMLKHVGDRYTQDQVILKAKNRKKFPRWMAYFAIVKLTKTACLTMSNLRTL